LINVSRRLDNLTGISKDKTKGNEGARIAAHVYDQNSEATQNTPLEEFESSKAVTT